MSNDEIRIAIAQECPRYQIKFDSKEQRISIYELGNFRADGRMDEIQIVLDLGKIPNYPEDLNAMHEAEKTLEEKEWFRYHQEIAVQTGTENYSTAWEWRDRFAAIHATARQRAEAFLRVKGLWK